MLVCSRIDLLKNLATQCKRGWATTLVYRQTTRIRYRASNYEFRRYSTELPDSHHLLIQWLRECEAMASEYRFHIARGDTGESIHSCRLGSSTKERWNDYSEGTVGSRESGRDDSGDRWRYH